MNIIPQITHPLGRHWDQPRDIRDAPMDDTHVLLTPFQVRLLPEYSTSMPSGVYAGKCWKWVQLPKFGNDKWLIWYGNEVSPNEFEVCKRKILEIL